MPRKTNVKSPEERASAVAVAERKAKKGYKHNLKKPRTVTEEELEVFTDMAVSLRLVGYSNTQIAAVVGLSRGQVAAITKDEAFQKRIKLLRSKIPEAALNLGKAYLVEAVQAVVHVMRTETDSAMILKAAAELFDRFGIPKTSRTESKQESADEPDTVSMSIMNKLRDASPEVQEKVAQLQESFAEGVSRILMEDSNGNSE